MSGRPEIVVCASIDTLYERAARLFADAARTSVAARGRFAVALPGGDTPRPMLERLAEPPHRDGVRWDRVEVFWSDERCVPPDAPRSNFRMAREALLDRVPVDPKRVHRVRGEDPDPERAAALYERGLRAALGVPRGAPHLDLVILGLGADGHTASLFPGSEALLETERLARAVRASEPGIQPPIVERVTLTPPALNAAWEVAFLVVGEAKAPAVWAVLEGPREPSRWPAQTIDPVRGRARWLLDGSAAGRLSDLAPAPAGEP